MSEKIENPPAFPVSSIDGFTQHGMTLLDYFAGQALAGINANPQFDGVSWAAVAKNAFECADAMLRERMKGQTP